MTETKVISKVDFQTSENMDGYFIDYVLKLDEDDTPEVAFEAFREEVWIESYYSAYDCTGQHFSSSLDILHFDDTYYMLTIRHSISIDV